MGTERQREIRRRRSRQRKVQIIKRRAASASASERAVLSAKLRKLTPGAEELISNLGLEER